jgi:hypothetical protein
MMDELSKRAFVIILVGAAVVPALLFLWLVLSGVI